MKQFVDLPDNAPMAEASPHFPVVCRDGEPMGVAGAAAGDLIERKKADIGGTTGTKKGLGFCISVAFILAILGFGGALYDLAGFP